MEDVRKILVWGFTVVNLVAVNVFGAFTILMYLTLAAMLLDLVTRVYAAAVNPSEIVESKKIMAGFWRKFGLCLLICVSLLLDLGIKQITLVLGINIAVKIMVTALTIAWIFVREITSNLENLKLAGIELPNFISKALGMVKDAIDSTANKIIGGGK